MYSLINEVKNFKKSQLFRKYSRPLEQSIEQMK